MVNIQGYVLCRQAKVTSRYLVMGTLAAQLSARVGLWCNLTSDSGRYIVIEEQGLFGPAHVGRHACLGLGEVPAAVLSYAASLALRRRPCSITFRCQVFRRGRLANLVLFDQPFRFRHGLLLMSIYEVKYTTLNPIQLPTTPSAEYALVNINGRNS